MGTSSSEIAANRHNSGKFETFNALQNDLIWLLLHSWFQNFSEEDPWTPPTRGTLGKIAFLFFTPLLHAPNCVIMIQIIVIYLLSVCDCQFLKICGLFICSF